jgi:hypothetical protein
VLPGVDVVVIGGWFWTERPLAAGEAATVAVRLGDLMEISAPGEYHLRFAWRDGYDRFVDTKRNELMSGYLLLYSEPFTLIVGEQ